MGMAEYLECDIVGIHAGFMSNNIASLKKH